MIVGTLLGDLRDSARPRHLRSRLGDPRFWVIQALVIAVASLHFLMETAEEDSALTAFWGGFVNFPVEVYVVPVIVAGLWFGLEGGVLTGAWITVLSIPNLWIFHTDGYSWIGELLSNLFVISVGIVVAAFVERERRSRRTAQETNRRLETRNEVTSAISRETSPDAVVRSTLWALTAMPAVGAASFVPVQSAADLEPCMVGDPERGKDLTAMFSSVAGGLAELPIHGGHPVEVFPVAVAESEFGNLAVACGDEVVSREDLSLFRTVATDLAVGLESLRLKEVERTDLQRYAQAVTVAQETERKRLARELHDGPAQSLIILSRSLSRVATNGPISESVAAEIADMQEVTRHTLDAIRRTSRALRPALLDDLGLVPALEALVERHDRRVEGKVEFSVNGEPRRLPPDAELAAFRVVQEALANVRRHARADSTLVSLEFLDDVVVATVADDGRGFDARDLEGRGSLGVTGMRERAELVGAKLKLKTAPSNGTTVRLKIPA